ncbi:unnamed protein product [Rotaria magnacalcarata]|uniref:Cilia- and flagella-associated protein 91 n=2 Tax=Rotaria magnacalcarata TaxID=392030 RepID=A0A819BB12_9BILA|nr:unnamed protein product [Rotaria magnacalcarata]CAF3798031.1 unnamed protein product [Rotaria magnacalcarata]CAF3884662.1 unnamed protein product [Rotaria magnacalcarata]
MQNQEFISYIRHIGSQTDYREESTQTDPFSPIYTISGGEHPEVFALADFIYGKGLPVTSLEISFIERLRARRQWEQDHTIDMTRTKIVIEREIRQWQIRENEIKMSQDTCHKLYKKNLHTYIKTDEDLTQYIIDFFIYRREKQLKSQYTRIDVEATRDIRRIKRMHQLRQAQINAMTSYNHLGAIGMSQHGNGCYTTLKSPWHKQSTDIITNFKNTTSKIHTPCSNLNYLIDRHFHHIQKSSFNFEELLPQNALVVKIEELDRLRTLENSTNRKKLSHRIRNLEKAYQLIKQDKNKQLIISERKPLRFVEKIETIDDAKQLEIKPTQTERPDHHRIVIVKLQNYLRNELINGLKQDQTSSIDVTNDNFVSSRNQIYDYLEGATIADMLNFLSQDLLRLQCEQTIHLFVLLADRYRYQREATETAYRTISIDKQKLEDHALQQMFSLQSDSDIKSYIEDLILESITHTANEQGKSEIRQITETLTDLTDQINSTISNQSEIELIVSQLVYQFLLPKVQRILTKENNRNFYQHIKLPSINK